MRCASTTLALAAAAAFALGCTKQDATYEIPPLPPADEPSADLAPPPAPLPPAPPAWPGALDTAAQARLYHQPVGGETLSLSFLRALRSSAARRPFLEDLGRFGMVRDPSPDNKEQLPVGMTLAAAGDGRPSAMVGVGCGACHVAEVRHEEKALRVDGARNAFDRKAFFADALTSVRDTLMSAETAMKFTERFRAELNGTSFPEINAAVLSATCPGCDSAEIDRKVGEQIPWLVRREPRPEMQSEMAKSPKNKALMADVRKKFDERFFALKAYFVYLQGLADRPEVSGQARCDWLSGANKGDAAAGLASMLRDQVKLPDWLPR